MPRTNLTPAELRHSNALGAKIAEHDAALDATIALQKVSTTIAFSDLSDAVNGEAQAVNVGSALPANAVIVGHQVALTTQFTGGSASAVKMDLGVSGDTTSLINQFDVFGATASGKKYSPGAGHLTTHGDHLTGDYSSAQLIATFTPDGSHHLSALTAGALTITIYYSVVA